MVVGVKLYKWLNPLAPKGAETDTPPGSPQRRLLDTLIDPNGRYKVLLARDRDGKNTGRPFTLDGGYQIERGKWKPGEKGNNVYRFAEALEFIEQSPNGWKEYRPALDKIKLIDPIDPRKIDPRIKERMGEIKVKLDKDIDMEFHLKPDDPKYCDAFVPRFYKEGLPHYKDGGLCFGYPKRDSKDFKLEQPADRTYQACINDEITWGNCSETVYKILSFYKYLGVQCNAYSVYVYYQNETNGHLFSEYKGIELDPSGIGRRYSKADYRPLTHRQLIGNYYKDLTADIGEMISRGEKTTIDPVYTGTMAVLIDPESSSSHNSLGSALEKKNDIAGAISEYKRALELREKYPNAHNNLGTALYIKGDINGAIREFQRALELREKFPEVHYNLGYVLYKKGDINGAIREYRRALEMREKDPDTHNNLGNALLEKGDITGAIREYRRALELRENDPDIHHNLGVALRKKGLKAEAERHFKRAK